jgi:chromosome partitioning protein
LSLLKSIQDVQKRLNPDLKILGVLSTSAQMQTVITPVFEPVPTSVKFAESNLAGEPINVYAGDKKLVQPYQAIYDFIAAGEK